MNIRNTLKSAVIALPLLFGHGNAAAQKVAHTAVKDTARTTAVDTLKAMDNMAVDARTFVMNKADSVKADSVAKKNVETVIAYKADSMANHRTKVEADVSIGAAHHLPGGIGTRAHVGIQKHKDVFDASAMYSTAHGKSTMYGDGQYTRLFPSKKIRNFQYTAGIGLNNTVVRDIKEGAQHYGVFSPRVTAGFRYKTPMTYREWPTDSYFAIKAEAGPAAKIQYNNNAKPNNNKVKPALYVNTEAEFGKKHVAAFGRVGHSPVLGFNAGVGVRYKF